jgi:hypothetical protein
MRSMAVSTGVLVLVLALAIAPHAQAAWQVGGSSSADATKATNGAATRVQIPSYVNPKPACNNKKNVKVHWSLGSPGVAPASYRLTVTADGIASHEDFQATSELTYTSKGTYRGDLSVTLSARLGTRWVQSTGAAEIRNC